VCLPVPLSAANRFSRSNISVSNGFLESNLTAKLKTDGPELPANDVGKLSLCCRLQLKCGGTRCRTGGEMKGKLVNGVGSQYPSHYLGTWCIQHYYRWCAHLGCQQSTELTLPADLNGPLRFARKTKSGFCACAITFQTQSINNVRIYEGCPESIRPVWVSQEPFLWPWCNLAASQRRPYCTSVSSHSPVGLVSQQWDAIDWACVVCDRLIHKSPPFKRRFYLWGKPEVAESQIWSVRGLADLGDVTFC